LAAGRAGLLDRRHHGVGQAKDIVSEHYNTWDVRF